MSQKEPSMLVHLHELKDRIKLGSLVIRMEDYPSATFLIGYFMGRANLNIEELFEFM
jgi:hypothetical protein